MVVFIKRRGWDSNPRALSDKRFSRPPRYDHFDTSPSIYLSAASVSPQRQDVFYHSFSLSSTPFSNFFYFSYFPVFFIYKYTYFSSFIHRTCHRQLLLHILISTEPTIGKFFQMHGNSQIPAQDYRCSINPFAVSRSSGVVILILQ